jgi:hypothetical protein
MKWRGLVYYLNYFTGGKRFAEEMEEYYDEISKNRLKKIKMKRR